MADRSPISGDTLLNSTIVAPIGYSVPGFVPNFLTCWGPGTNTCAVIRILNVWNSSDSYCFSARQEGAMNHFLIGEYLVRSTKAKDDLDTRLMQAVKQRDRGRILLEASTSLNI